MPIIGSNQYPALPWEDNPDHVHGGIIARPHGSVSSARVYYAAYYPQSAQWVWVVNWPDRFGRDASAVDEQAAKEAATLAYWDFMEETEGWTPKPLPPPPPPVDPKVQEVQAAVDSWLARKPGLDAIVAQIDRFRMSTIIGPAIHTPEIDRWIWTRMSNVFARRNH